jgi:hypothetical protein
LVAAKRGGLLPRDLSAGALRRGGVEGADCTGVEQSLQGCGASGEDDAGDGAFAETDLGFGVGGWYKERTQKAGEIGVVADDEEVFSLGALVEKTLELFKCALRGERGGVENLGFVAGFGADERGGLEATLERARDDEIELDVECIQYVSELEAVLFAFFIEGAFGVEQGVDASKTSAGMAKNVQIHNLFTFYRRRVAGWYRCGECEVSCWS